MKNPLLVVSLVLLLCFAFGCQNKTEKAELEKFRTQAKVEEQNIELAKRTAEAWSKGDNDALKELWAPDVAWYLPSRSIFVKSQEEGIEFGKSLLKAFPDLVVSIEEAYAVGDRVVVRYLWRATHQGVFAGVPATGNKVETSGIAIWRFENGKIVESREEFDNLSLMGQLGMELKPKEVKK